ncbi:unnamed protein product [Rangifer tarandus platyrhynchus]|uniref:Uncharacterized protein n=1 Tax=Rangifer tarandus platyrhynchus TaxID=3082113 RepID=A0ABN9A2K5_RANTA|nr:unnamed protein product [Rangifer tarandus platyrhynchus]
MQKDPRPRELGFGRKAGRRRKKKKKVSQPQGEEGTAGPALPGAQAERAAGDVPAGPACPEPGSAAGGVPKVPANVRHPSAPPVPAEKALEGSPEFAKGINEVRVTPAPEESSDWSCCRPNPGGPCPPSGLLPSGHPLTDDPV